jgi:hypothetical protein
MKRWQERWLDDLVCQVYHVNLSQCRDFEEFKGHLGFMMRNLRQVSDSLGGALPLNLRIRRAAESLKSKADRLLALCNAVPESFDAPEEWRAVAGQLGVNYEILRFEAGYLYQLVVPKSPFGVLRSAL